MIIEENWKRKLSISKETTDTLSNIDSLESLLQHFVKLDTEDIFFENNTLNDNFKDYLYEVWFNYFALLCTSFKIFDNANNEPIKYTPVKADDYKTESHHRYNSRQNNLRFSLSPFYHLLECITGNDNQKINKQNNDNDSSADNDSSTDNDSFSLDYNTKKYHTPKLRRGSSMVIKCPIIYQHIFLAIKTYSKYCPFTYNTDFSKEDQDFSWTEAQDDLHKYPSFVSFLKPMYIDAILSYGGAFSIDYFAHRNNPLHNNSEIRNYKSIRSFYNKVYSFLEGYHSDNKTENYDAIAFEYFLLEYLLNGTFLFHFADVFSNQTMGKIYKSNKAEVLKLFRQISIIPNIFYRHFLLNLIKESYNNTLFFKKQQVFVDKK